MEALARATRARQRVQPGRGAAAVERGIRGRGVRTIGRDRGGSERARKRTARVRLTARRPRIRHQKRIVRVPTTWTSCGQGTLRRSPHRRERGRADPRWRRSRDCVREEGAKLGVRSSTSWSQHDVAAPTRRTRGVSPAREGLSLVHLEALAAGCAVSARRRRPDELKRNTLTTKPPARCSPESSATRARCDRRPRAQPDRAGARLPHRAKWRSQRQELFGRVLG